MKRLLITATILAGLAAGAAQASEVITHTTDQSFDDVMFGLENAIVDQGLVIDATSKIGEMLERTRADVGSDKVIFEQAVAVSFCSAKLSRKVMEIDPMNIGFCPYDIFVSRLPGSDQTVIGYRSFPEGEMKEVEALIDTIVREAIGMN